MDQLKTLDLLINNKYNINKTQIKLPFFKYACQMLDRYLPCAKGTCEVVISPMTVQPSPRTKNLLCLNLIPFQPSEVILDSDEDNDEVVIIFMGRVSK